MVYCGKPSRGCQMCRTRRIKCDENKPTCHQCLKSRRQCPGYKDDFDLVFRNETQATERRARRSLNSRKITFPTAQNQHGNSGPARIMSGTDTDIRRTYLPRHSSSSTISYQGHLTVPLEKQAVNYFLANWVLVPKPGKPIVVRGHLHYILPLIKHEPPGSHLMASVEAVSLAALGNRPNSKPVLVKAWQTYTKALAYVNRALADPTAQKTDQTLAAVLLLGLFETITLRRTNIAAWGTHIDGAVMLVKMRGKKQLRTKIGNALFIAVRHTMLISCMSASKSPDLGVDWWLSGDGRHQATHSVSELILRVTELRADVNRAMMLMPRTPENATKIQDLIHRAGVIEAKFLEWLPIVPEEWKPRTVSWMDAVPSQEPEMLEIFPGKVDMYMDLSISALWNMYRVARLFLTGIVIRCVAWTCAPVDYRTTPEYASASRLGIEMIGDMIASVPYHLGWIGEKGKFKTEMHSEFACGEDNTGAAKALGAYFLVWPLFTAICSDFTTDAQRKYITGRLNFMADNLGLKQAAVLSRLQLRLPSMIVKRDSMGLAVLDKKVPGSDQAKIPTTSYPAKATSITSIPRLPAHPVPYAYHISDRAAAINADPAARLRPDLNLLTETETHHSGFKGNARSSTQDQPSRQQYQTLATITAQHTPSISPRGQWNSPQPTKNPFLPLRHDSTNHIFNSQRLPSPISPPQPPASNTTTPSSSSNITSNPSYTAAVSSVQLPAYDPMSTPARGQAEDVSEEDLRLDKERHLAERVAYTRSFVAVIREISGEEVVDGMYHSKQSKMENGGGGIDVDIDVESDTYIDKGFGSGSGSSGTGATGTSKIKLTSGRGDAG